MTKYKPALFRVIAEQVANNYPEQYLFASSGSLKVMFSDERVENAISLALEAMGNGINVVTFEYVLLEGAQANICFYDGARGLIDVDGVLVELVIRKLGDDGWRVLFSRIDAHNLYADLATRIARLEATVVSITDAR